MKNQLLSIALITCISLTSVQSFAQKAKIYVFPDNAQMFLNSAKIPSPKNINLKDPNIGILAVLKGYATQTLKPFDLKDDGISEYTMDMVKLVKPAANYKSKKIEFTKLIDRTGKVEKGSVPTGWYGTTTTATDFDDAMFTSAISSKIADWGYSVVSTNTMFKDSKNVASFGLGGELTFFTKDTRGSGFQVSIFVKWSLYSVEEGTVVYEKTMGGYSDSKSTSKFNTELVFAFEDALQGMLGDPEFTKIVSEESESTITPDMLDPIYISKLDYTMPSKYSQFVKETMSSVVTVKTNFGHGSGFIISESGYILTNNHVIKNADKIDVIFNNGFSFSAELVRSDNKRDIAIIKIPGKGYKPLTLSNAEPDSDVGEDVILIGTPESTDLGQTVTKGIISGQRKIDDQTYLQTDVALNSGNSGGPLVNSSTGGVVGVVVSKLVGSGVEGLGFAIPIEDCRTTLNIKYK